MSKVFTKHDAKDCYIYFLTLDGRLSRDEIGNIIIDGVSTSGTRFRDYFTYSYPLDHFLERYINQE